MATVDPDIGNPEETQGLSTKFVGVTGPALRFYCGVPMLAFEVPSTMELDEEGLVQVECQDAHALINSRVQVEARQTAKMLIKSLQEATIIGLPELSLYRQLRRVGFVEERWC